MYKALIGSACAAVILVSGMHIYDRRAKQEAVSASVRNLISVIEKQDASPQRNAEEVATSNNLRDAW